MQREIRAVLGVDEAGRGPLAGPVAVGVVMAPRGFNIEKAFPGVADSKQLSAHKRAEIFNKLRTHEVVRWCVRLRGAGAIDTLGITRAVRSALYSGVRALAPEPSGARILLDGLLHAPPEYAQETIIGGDASEPIISLASIAAKVVRDKHMERLARAYPQYLFEQHKGYGTALHYARIKEHGPCAIHRTSFLHLDTEQIVA